MKSLNECRCRPEVKFSIMSSPPPTFFAGRDLWRLPLGELFRQRKTFFKRRLHRHYRIFASIAHRFGRRLTPAGWVVVGGTVAAAALGADTNASLSYQT